MDKFLVFVAFLNVLAIARPAPAPAPSPRISPLIPVQQIEDVKKGDLETASNFFSGFYSGYPYSSFPGGYYGFANSGSTPFTQPLNNKPELCILLNESVTGKNSTSPNPNPPKLCIPITQNYFLRNANGNGNGNSNDGNSNNNNNNNNNQPVVSSINQFPSSINQLLANNNNFNNVNNNNNNNQNQNAQVLNSVNLNQLFPNGINQFLANNNLSPFLTNSQIRQL